MPTKILLPDSIFEFKRIAYDDDQNNWRPAEPNMAMERIPDLHFRYEDQLIWIIDEEDETKCVVDTTLFINWLITKGQPHAEKYLFKYTCYSVV